MTREQLIKEREGVNAKYEELKAMGLKLDMSKGKPFINLLPLDEGENITTIMKLPENEADCKDMSIMFATAQGNVRRNSLMDFVNVQSNGKIAMKLDEGDKLVNVMLCTEDNDVMLAAKSL